MAPLGKTTPLPRYVFLDGLRGVAALAIVVHHFTATSGHREVFASAAVAVDFFFCLSGFVIALAYHDRLLAGLSLWSYTRRRLERLYPMYLVGWVMGIVAIGVVKSNGLTNMPWEAIGLAGLLNALYLPYFNDFVVKVYALPINGAIFPMNNPAWSLFYGMLANLIFAATLRHSRVTPAAWVAATGVGLVLGGYAFGTTPGWGTANFAGGIPRVLYAFFAGTLVFQLRDRLAALPRFAWPTVIAFVAAMFAVPRFGGYHYYWLACALVAIPLLVAFGSRVTIEPGSALKRVCEYSGKISYPIFCVHYPLLMIFSVTLPLGANYVPVAILYFVATVALAHVAMRLVEEPVRRRLDAGRAAA